VSSHVQPVQGRTAGRGRPALATGVLLLVASLVLLVPPPAGPLDARSLSPSPASRPPVDLLVQGPGAAAAVAAAGGRPLAALPIVDGLLARVPGGGAAALARRPGVRSVTDADQPLTVRGLSPRPGLELAAHPLVADPDPFGGESSPRTPQERGRRGVGVGVLDTGIADNGDLAGRVVASADLSGEWSFSDSYGHGTFMAGLIAGGGQGGGPAGVAPGADLVDLKVAGADGSTTLGQVLAAMQLADASRERFNLRVLNVSLGAPADDRATAPLTEAVERLWADGITVVTAAGNEAGGSTRPGWTPTSSPLAPSTRPRGPCPPGAAAGRTSPAGPSRIWWRRGSAWSACAPRAPPSTWPTRRPGSATATSAGRAPPCRPRWSPGRRPWWPRPTPTGDRTGSRRP
jgi:serine protease AprX